MPFSWDWAPLSLQWIPLKRDLSSKQCPFIVLALEMQLHSSVHRRKTHSRHYWSLAQVPLGGFKWAGCFAQVLPKFRCTLHMWKKQHMPRQPHVRLCGVWPGAWKGQGQLDCRQQCCMLLTGGCEVGDRFSLSNMQWWFLEGRDLGGFFSFISSKVYCRNFWAKVHVPPAALGHHDLLFCLEHCHQPFECSPAAAQLCCTHCSYRIIC